MKIICTDNFARDSVADFLVAEGIKSDAWGACMCEALQAKYGGENSPHYFKAVADDYKLWGGMKELV